MTSETQELMSMERGDGGNAGATKPAETVTVTVTDTSNMTINQPRISSGGKCYNFTYIKNDIFLIF
ncbi:hypothetical protein B566_EDAN009376 [Ephemera danica]|nr:hypothetical protein B566_EDAN009376 [Ephemera danica]